MLAKPSSRWSETAHKVYAAAKGVRLVDLLHSRGEPRLQAAVGNEDWVCHWIARYLVKGVIERHGMSARVTKFPWLARRQILLFTNRYLFLRGPSERLHPSNQVFVNWWHGSPESVGDAFERMAGRALDLVPHLAAFVVTSDAIGEPLIAAGFPAEKIVRIPLGVDLDHFGPADDRGRARARAALGLADDAFCIGSFQRDGQGPGGLEPRLVKGPDVFLEAVAQLKQDIPQLFVLLTGSERGYVKAGLDRLGVPHHHAFLPNYLDVTKFYHACDATLISSRDEGGPMAFLESWACGVPVVSTRVGMPRDWIEPGVNGYLADVGDATGLAAGVRALAADREHWGALRARGLSEVQPFAWDRIVEQYVHQLFEPALAALSQAEPPA